ncbi:MAG: hypothetical protein AAB339_13140 [Elusimicrobiota bacterium]
MVLPRHLTKGELGGPYDVGWAEQKKAGKPIIEGVMDLPDRMPETTK